MFHFKDANYSDITCTSQNEAGVDPSSITRNGPDNNIGK